MRHQSLLLLVAVILFIAVASFFRYPLVYLPTHGRPLQPVDSPQSGGSAFANRWQRLTEQPQAAAPPEHNHGHEGHGHTHEEPSPLPPVIQPSASTSTATASKSDGHVHDDDEFPQLAECTALRTQHNIIPGKSWGQAPPQAQARWGELFCDDPFANEAHHNAARQQKGPAARFGGREASHETFSRDIDVKAKPANTTWIVFLTPMTTLHGKTKMTAASQLVFWELLFPSFIAQSRAQLLDPSDKYWYSFYIGYDDGDPLLSLPETHEAIWNQMQERLRKENIPLRKVGLRFFTMSDTVHAPSWAVSHLAQAAFDAGADYFYQVNDDVNMETSGWEDTLTGLLKSSHGVGATGPMDRSNQGILTQSFAHRTHLEIFGMYFAETFKNWWSDDWLTAVYGPYTHRNHNVFVRHVHDKEGQRYPVHQAQGQLHAEVEKGKQKVREYIKTKGLKLQL